MGLQFRDEAGNERALTLEDMKTQDFRESYFDLYKGLYGIKPRWETSPETMLRFFDNYEAELEESMERDRLEDENRLAYLISKHGLPFVKLHEAESYNMSAAKVRYEREAEERATKEAEKAEFGRRGSPMPAIVAWEHGVL